MKEPREFLSRLAVDYLCEFMVGSRGLACHCLPDLRVRGRVELVYLLLANSLLRSYAQEKTRDFNPAHSCRAVVRPKGCRDMSDLWA